MENRITLNSLALLVLLSISACSSLGDVPSELRVDTGLEPQHIDEQVRFRTTYYFRVLESCPLEHNAGGVSDNAKPFIKRINGDLAPLSDSLYRFRMTGQAAALFNQIRFESGILKKEQIDPFGSTVSYNENTNSFIPISADQLRAQAKGETAMKDIAHMRKLMEEFKNDRNFSQGNRDSFEAKLKDIIEGRLEVLKNTPLGSETTPPISNAAPPKQPADPAATSQPQSDVDMPKQEVKPEAPQGLKDEQPKKGSCNGKASLKKYYLLGPEGAKELDPSDRLLMALSVDSKPLLGMLNQISEHKFRSHEAALHTIEAILDERGRIFDAHHTLLKAKDGLMSGEGSSEESALTTLSEILHILFSAPATTKN